MIVQPQDQPGPQRHTVTVTLVGYTRTHMHAHTVTGRKSLLVQPAKPNTDKGSVLNISSGHLLRLCSAGVKSRVHSRTLKLGMWSPQCEFPGKIWVRGKKCIPFFISVSSHVHCILSLICILCKFNLASRLHGIDGFIDSFIWVLVNVAICNIELNLHVFSRTTNLSDK